MGDGKTLLSRRSVGNIAHRIDRFMRRPGSDQYASSRQQSGGVASNPEASLDGCDNLQWLRHAADARFAMLRHLACVRADDRNAVGNELRKIAAGRSVVPH